jgi:hypothetical protein
LIIQNMIKMGIKLFRDVHRKKGFFSLLHLIDFKEYSLKSETDGKLLISTDNDNYRILKSSVPVYLVDRKARIPPRALILFLIDS